MSSLGYILRDSSDASTYDNTQSGLTATNMETAIKEVDARILPGAGSVKRIVFGSGLSGGTVTLTGTVGIDIVSLPAHLSVASTDEYIVQSNGGVASRETRDHLLTGIVTSVASGAGLTGGPITSTGTLSLDINSITAETAADEADTLAIYDNSAAALRKITRSNFLAGVGNIVSMKTATTTVEVGTAAPPTLGQVLTATGSSAATWQTLPVGGDALLANSLGQFAATTSAQLAGVISDETGAGALVLGTSPTFATPNLGTPASIVLANATGEAINLAVGSLSSNSTKINVQAANAPTPGQVLTATNANSATWVTQPDGDALVANSLSQFAATTSSQLAEVITGATGAGSLVFGTSHTLITPNLGTPTSIVLTNATGEATNLAAGSLLSNTTVVDVQTANAPTAGQVLKATSGVAATWVSPERPNEAHATNTLAQFAATTSVQLASVISDETGAGSLVFANAPTLIAPILGTPTSGVLTNCSGNAANLAVGSILSSTTTINVKAAPAPTAGQMLAATNNSNATWVTPSTGFGLLANPLSQFAATTSAQLEGVITDQSGNGLVVFNTSPTFVNPKLGTPASGTLTNCTGLPLSSVTGLGASVATFLATPSSANLQTAVTDETGTGVLVFATSPAFVTPALGTPSSGVLSSCTGAVAYGLTTATVVTRTPFAVPAMTSATDGGYIITESNSYSSPTNDGWKAFDGNINTNWGTQFSTYDANGAFIEYSFPAFKDTGLKLGHWINVESSIRRTVNSVLLGINPALGGARDPTSVLVYTSPNGVNYTLRGSLSGITYDYSGTGFATQAVTFPVVICTHVAIIAVTTTPGGYDNVVLNSVTITGSNVNENNNVSVFASAAPTGGQVLKATSGSTATWQAAGSIAAPNPTSNTVLNHMDFTGGFMLPANMRAAITAGGGGTNKCWGHTQKYIAGSTILAGRVVSLQSQTTGTDNSILLRATYMLDADEQNASVFPIGVAQHNATAGQAITVCTKGYTTCINESDVYPEMGNAVGGSIGGSSGYVRITNAISSNQAFVGYCAQSDYVFTLDPVLIYFSGGYEAY